MVGNWRKRLWPKLGLLMGPLSLAGCGKTCGSCHECNLDAAWPSGIFATDRSLVRKPLAQQAANGAVVYSTLFNYYFVLETSELTETGQVRQLPQPQVTAKLTPWGKELLNRLGRHANGHLDVYVQVAADLVNSPMGPDGPIPLGKARADLTAQRVTAVRDYLASVRPDLSVNVGIIDPDTVGMTGKEARGGFDAMIKATPGTLSPETIQGANSSGPGAGGYGGGSGGPEGSPGPVNPGNGGGGGTPGGAPGGAGGG